MSDTHDEMGATTRKAVRAVIAGRVQGVWYRGWVIENAVGMGLDGWVRNRADGTVEAVFTGPPALVDKMAASCWHGPPSASVTSLTISPAEEAPAKGAGFQQLPTA